jgi:hypothetical protein
MGFWHDLGNWFTGGDASKQFAKDAAPKYEGYGAGMLQGALNGGIGNQQLNFGAADQSRGQMQGLAQQLGAVASGQQQGAGELAAQRQMHGAEAAQQAFARIARGSNAALAARQAARNTADLGVAGAGQAQQAALMDQAAARGQLGSVLSGMRGQDLNQQQVIQAQQGQNGQMQLNYLAQLLGLDQNRLQQALAQQQVKAADKGHLGSMLQAAGTIGGGIAAGPGGAAAGGQAGKAIGG